ncbi:DUF5682 family protein, partial [Streptomyces sp. MJM1172]|uniref:DUF5682 family protein n=1 Tax=Streptomyces sp. MJM1172 TaxID=1703926 RepID=UPI00093EC8C1
MTELIDPRAAVDALAACREPYLLGVRHHSPALAAVVPALLDAAGAEVVCVELPADFQPWLEHLADPETVAPVALAGAGAEGRLAFYPFADFSPELAAIRWARARGAEVVCCDLPLGDPGWTLPGGAGAPAPGRRPFADALSASGSGRDGDDLWDRAVEVLAPGCSPEAVRRAALGVGWGLRADAAVPATDLAREARMREVIAGAASGGRRVAAVIGAFHAPSLAPAPHGHAPVSPAPSDTSALPLPDADTATTGAATGAPTTAGTNPVPPGTEAAGRAGAPVAGRPNAGPGRTGPGPTAGAPAGEGTGTDATGRAGAAPGRSGPGPVNGVPVGEGTGAGSGGSSGQGVVTSLVAYAYELLDSRSGYPAGIRDPLWQQAVLEAGGEPERVREAASVAIVGVCRELRRAGHVAGTGEAAEMLRVACDLAGLRALPAPGRGELLEAVSSVLGGGRPQARALEAVLVGTGRGRVTPHAPRSGLGPSVEAELAELRLPSPRDPAPREVRLDPLRSPLDARREVMLQRLLVCGASYGEQLAVAATGDGTALGTKWRLSWTPSVPARLDLAGVRGVNAAQAAAGTLRDVARRAAAEGGPTPAQVLTGLAAAARCELPELVDVRMDEAAAVLPETAALPELLQALELLEGLRRGHFPGTPAEALAAAGELTGELLEAAVRALPGLAGSDDPADAGALVALADRAAGRHLGLRIDSALAELSDTASPLMQGAALAVRVLLDLDPAAGLGGRAAGWIDGAVTPGARRALARRLGGLLTAAGPLLQSSPAALTPLLDRVDGLADQAFLDRLPALRGGFDALSPAARGRLLDTVTERLGDRIDVSLDAPPALLALWAAADAAGLAALKSLPLPAPATGAAGAAGPGDPAAPGATGRCPAAADQRLAPADRWRLLLGRQRDRLPADARRYARALDELYGAG